MSSKSVRSPLLDELDGMYKDLREGIKKAKFLGKSLAPALEPLERIIIFVAKVVKKLESLESEKVNLEDRISWLEQELNRRDEERLSK